MGPPECRPGVDAQVSRLPGSARDALDRTGPVAFDGSLPAMDAAARLLRLIAISDRWTSVSYRGLYSRR
jgi:hypothetical protein